MSIFLIVGLAGIVGPAQISLMSTYPLAGAVDASQRTEECFGKIATIQGTEGNDNLTGTPGPDVIVGGDGRDEIDGFGGDDWICGGPGDDKIWGRGGDDHITDAATGHAIGDVFGGPGRDVLRATGDSGLTLEGGRGGDRLVGGKIMSGGPGDDRLIATAVSEADMSGGPGDDLFDGSKSYARARYQYAAEGVTVNLEKGVAQGEGDDTLIGIMFLTGSPFDDVLIGGSGRDDIWGARGGDRIFGRAGNDGLDGNMGVDYVKGGRGRDLCRGEEIECEGP